MHDYFLFRKFKVGYSIDLYKIEHIALGTYKKLNTYKDFIFDNYLKIEFNVINDYKNKGFNVINVDLINFCLFDDFFIIWKN